MTDVGTTRPRDEILAEVLAGVAGGTSVVEVFARGAAAAKRPDDWPSERTFWRWVATDDSVRVAYLAALKARGYRHVEEIFGLADELARPDITAEEIAAARLRVDVRKWNAARMLPKLYGDRTIVAGDDEHPIRIDDARVVGRLLPELAPVGTPETPGEPDESGT